MCTPPPTSMCLRTSIVLLRNHGVVLVHFFPTQKCRGTRGPFLRTAMTSPVPWKIFFLGIALGDVCPFLSQSETHGQIHWRTESQLTGL